MRQMNEMGTRWSRPRRRGVLAGLLGALFLSGTFAADAQVVVDDNGKVGIGTGSPTRKLHVHEPNSLAGGAFIVLNHVNNGASDTDGLEISANSDGSVNLWGRENGAMHIATNNTERVTISASGNVGIATTSPDAKLNVVSSTASFPDSFDNNLKLTGPAPGLWLHESDINTGQFLGLDGGVLSIGRESAGGLSAYTMTLTSGGNVGIGTTNPASRLDVSGGCINGSMCSDARLKEDIRSLPKQESYLEKVLRLRGVSFQWKGRPQQGRQMGLIAQEVETVLPEAVTTPEGETAQKGLSCTALDAALIEAIKEQQAQIRALEERLGTMQKDLVAIQRTQSLSLVSHPSH